MQWQGTAAGRTLHAQEHAHGLVAALLLHHGDEQDGVPRRAADQDGDPGVRLLHPGYPQMKHAGWDPDRFVTSMTQCNASLPVIAV